MEQKAFHSMWQHVWKAGYFTNQPRHFEHLGAKPRDNRIDTQGFSLNRKLNRKAAAKTFKRDGKILIPDILSDECAVSLTGYLSGRKEWNLVFRSQGKHYDVSASGFESLPSNEQNEFRQSVYSSAQRDFGYMYKNYPILDLVEAGNCEKFLEHFLNFVNSDAVLNTIRRITGIENIDYADAQATRYEPGHFLTSHDDIVPGKNRLAAYVFNLTTEWFPDWGGNLMFYDDENKISKVFVPLFNSLSLFLVGNKHAVSTVSPFARRPRMAITGWFRYR